MDEYTSSTMYSIMDQSDPVMTFQSFIDDDDESIVDDVIFNILQVIYYCFWLCCSDQ